MYSHNHLTRLFLERAFPATQSNNSSVRIMGLYVQHSMALCKLDKEDADAEEDASQPHCLQHGLRVRESPHCGQPGVASLPCLKDVWNKF